MFFATTPQELKPFEMHLKTLRGVLITFKMRASDTIDKLRAKTSGTEGIPEDHIRLIFAGKQLEDGKTLNDYNIEQGCTVSLAQLGISFGFI